MGTILQNRSWNDRCGAVVWQLPATHGDQISSRAVSPWQWGTAEVDGGHVVAESFGDGSQELSGADHDPKVGGLVADDVCQPRTGAEDRAQVGEVASHATEIEFRHLRIESLETARFSEFDPAPRWHGRSAGFPHAPQPRNRRCRLCNTPRVFDRSMVRLSCRNSVLDDRSPSSTDSRRVVRV